MCYDFLLFIHIIGDVPFSKGIHRACFPTQFGKQAFLVYRPIFNGFRFWEHLLRCCGCARANSKPSATQSSCCRLPGSVPYCTKTRENMDSTCCTICHMPSCCSSFCWVDICLAPPGSPADNIAIHLSKEERTGLSEHLANKDALLALLNN